MRYATQLTTVVLSATLLLPLALPLVRLALFMV
jgi:hypothetical protein